MLGGAWGCTEVGAAAAVGEWAWACLDQAAQGELGAVLVGDEHGDALVVLGLGAESHLGGKAVSECETQAPAAARCARSHRVPKDTRGVVAQTREHGSMTQEVQQGATGSPRVGGRQLDAPGTRSGGPRPPRTPPCRRRRRAPHTPRTGGRTTCRVELWRRDVSERRAVTSPSSPTVGAITQQQQQTHRRVATHP